VATLAVSNTILNGTPADATDVEENYTDIENFVNTNVIQRDGSVQMIAPLTLFGTVSDDLHAVSKGYVDLIMPVGAILMFGGMTAPNGWLLCNGQSVQQATYPDLYNKIGNAYTLAGAPAGTFQVPNLIGRVVIGYDNRAVGTADTRFDAVGDSGGTWTTPLPQHQHAMAHTHEHPHVHTIGHTHEHPHTHTIAHTHDFDDTHQHNGEIVQTDAAGGAGLRLVTPPSEPGTAWADVVSLAHTTGTTAGSSASVSGQPSDATTGGASIGASGQPSEATTGASSAANTSNAGVTGTSAEHLPPYLVLSYIIKHDS
jgi:microcystin-dependent protein